jgi:hypothetical protein
MSDDRPAIVAATHERNVLVALCRWLRRLVRG